MFAALAQRDKQRTSHVQVDRDGQRPCRALAAEWQGVETGAKAEGTSRYALRADPAQPPPTRILVGRAGRIQLRQKWISCVTLNTVS
jgi:hypothetical protein